MSNLFSEIEDKIIGKEELMFDKDKIKEVIIGEIKNKLNEKPKSQHFICQELHAIKLVTLVVRYRACNS